MFNDLKDVIVALKKIAWLVFRVSHLLEKLFLTLFLFKINAVIVWLTALFYTAISVLIKCFQLLKAQILRDFNNIIYVYCS